VRCLVELCWLMNRLRRLLDRFNTLHRTCERVPIMHACLHLNVISLLAARPY